MLPSSESSRITIIELTLRCREARVTTSEFIDKYEKSAETTDDVVADTNEDDFGDYSLGSMARTTSSELDEFLRLPTVKTKDPLAWWQNNCRVYPMLHRMALDYLSVPATSTAVERVFSQGRQLLHFTRNRLAPSTIRAFLCLGAWGRSNLLAMEDLLASVKSQKRKRNEVEAEADDEEKYLLSLIHSSC